MMNIYGYSLYIPHIPAYIPSYSLYKTYKYFMDHRVLLLLLGALGAAPRLGGPRGVSALLLFEHVSEVPPGSALVTSGTCEDSVNSGLQSYSYWYGYQDIPCTSAGQ